MLHRPIIYFSRHNQTLKSPCIHGCVPSILLSPHHSLPPADYNQNPFASTHSLDTNPFDDPAPPHQPGDAVRLDQLRQRELDLERREQELAAKADNIRKHGRNNWPPCPSTASQSRTLL
jgi:hypothetical protein